MVDIWRRKTTFRNIKHIAYSFPYSAFTMSSKSFQSFDGKIRSLKQHLQLLDLSLIQSNTVCLKQKNNGKTIAETLYSNLDKHPQLNIPNLSKDIMRAFVTTRKKVNEQAIVELYAYFSDYLASVIRELENTKPLKILSLVPADKNTHLTYKDIFNLSSYDNILDEIAKRVYRALEDERSMPKLLKRFIKTTKLNIPINLQEDALTYLEVRHLIIHGNSKADSKFHSLNQRGLVKVNSSNQMLSINYQMTSAAIIKVSELCKKIDDELLAKGLL